MSPEKKRIAIAEACGWNLRCTLAPMSPEGCVGLPVPDYLNDLNAMHEAEKILTNNQRRFYASVLIQVHPLKYDPREGEDQNMKLFLIVSMTAAQRAEAFLKTIGKWEESK